jgi:PAS domain S-box-containing protein
MTTPAKSPDINSNNEFNLELYFELSPDLLCIAGFDGYFKRINETVSKTLGYTKEELFAKPINEFVHPEDRDITARNRDNLRQNHPLLNFENRYITKSGEIIWLSWTSMPIESEKMIFAIAKNITHKRMIEEDRNSLLANLTKVNRDLKQLTYTTSHDLRSPVNNLLSVFSFLDLSKIRDKETLEFIGMLQSATATLKDSLDNYVDILTSKEVLNVHLEELDLKECLDAVLLSLKSLIRDSKAAIKIDFSAFKKIKFNRAYLESIFLNLITNSVKYANPDHYPVISIYTNYENGIHQLIVKDEGMGFDVEKVKDRVFGFNQKFHDHTDSKGIGLYLVYNHITSLGGNITVESKPDKGAKFVISFKRE